PPHGCREWATLAAHDLPDGHGAFLRVVAVLTVVDRFVTARICHGARGDQAVAIDARFDGRLLLTPLGARNHPVLPADRVEPAQFAILDARREQIVIVTELGRQT